MAFIGAIVFVEVTTKNSAGRFNNAFILPALGLILINIPWILRLALRLKIPQYIDAYFISLLIAAFIMGEVFGFYDKGLYFDKFMHVITGAVVAVAGFSFFGCFSNRFKSTTSAIVAITIIAFCVSMTIAIKWEVLEFAMDTIMRSNAQRWQDIPSTKYFQGSGLIDTMWDLIVHMGGAVIACVAVAIFLKGRPHSTALFIYRKPKTSQKSSS